MAAGVQLSPVPIQRFVDNNGVALVGGKLFTYIGGTTTKLATFTDSGGLTQQTNPIIMNSRGEPENNSGLSIGIWLTPGSNYKFVLAPSTDTDPPANPIWTLDNFQVQTIPPVFVAPNVTQYLSGSGTYTTPLNGSTLPLWIMVEMVGGGGGGGGAGASGATTGGTGGTTTFGSFTAIGGSGGPAANGGQAAVGGIGGTGGSGSGTPRIAGSAGTGSVVGSTLGGGGGGNSPFFSGGAGFVNAGTSPLAGIANSGGGGGGAQNSTNVAGGGGGGEGVRVLISAPVSSYSYAVGAAGAAGTGTGAGAAGGSGIIIITAGWQ